MIRFDGTLVVAPNRPGKTYGDSVTPELWQTVDLESLGHAPATLSEVS